MAWLIRLFYILGGMVIGYFVVTVDDQKFWLIALAVWFIGFAIIGNWWFFIGSRARRAKFNKDTGKWND